MIKSFAFRSTLFCVAFLTFTLSSAAHAGDISWSGLYRFEALKLHDAQLDGAFGRDKAYELQHLILSPKIVAGDGLNVYGRFDILNNPGSASGNLAGQTFGGAAINQNQGADSSSTPDMSGNGNVFSDSQGTSALAVSEVYATWVNEFGVLVVGRSPLQFGLGMTYNAGNGLFDHYVTTRDMVGYKVVLGNFYVMPMIGKTREGNLGFEDDVNDYMVQAQYDNPETDLSLGLFLQLRTAAKAGNDSPSGANAATPATAPYAGIGGAGATRTGGFKSQSVNFFVKEKAGPVNVGVEAGLVSGKTGITSATGSDAKISSYGVAAEVSYAAEHSGWSFLGKLGTASGDDPNSTDNYGSFTFNRNYNVGLILFNHPLGQADFLRSYAVRSSAPAAAGSPTTHTASDQLDTEAVSNAIYISPSAQYKWNDKVSAGATFVWAALHQDALLNSGAGSATGQSKDLGYELDFNLNYKPYERLTWITELGFLEPGDAFKGGSMGYSTSFVYAISTKAAISF